MTKQYYASPETSLKLFYGDEGEPSIRFVGGSLILDDENKIEAVRIAYLDSLLDPENPEGEAIRRLVRKIDREGALVAAKAFQQRRRNLGVSGSLTSADLQIAESAEIGPEQMVNDLMHKHGCSREEALELYKTMESDLVRTVPGTVDTVDATADNKKISLRDFAVGGSNGSWQGKAGDTGDIGNAGGLPEGAQPLPEPKSTDTPVTTGFEAALLAAKQDKNNAGNGA